MTRLLTIVLTAGLVVGLTSSLAGMFAMPSYGGNRDHVGWSLLGFPHQHAWQPPFGHYDAQESGDDEPA